MVLYFLTHKLNCFWKPVTTLRLWRYFRNQMNKLASRNPDAKEQNRELKRTCLRFTLRKFKVKSSLKSSRQQSVRPWARFHYYEMYTKVSLTLPIYNPIKFNPVSLSTCFCYYISRKTEGRETSFPLFYSKFFVDLLFFVAQLGICRFMVIQSIPPKCHLIKVTPSLFLTPFNTKLSPILVPLPLNIVQFHL